MGITIDGDKIEEITMDGDEIVEVTMDGVTVWELEIWPDGGGYIYDKSTHEDEWADAIIEETGDIILQAEKKPEHLYLLADAVDTHDVGEIIFYSKETIDLTEYDNISIQWKGTFGKESSGSSAMFIVSKNQIGNYDDYDARVLNEAYNFDTTDTIDISGSEFNDDFYIRIHAEVHRRIHSSSYHYNNSAEIEVYEIQLS